MQPEKQRAGKFININKESDCVEKKGRDIPEEVLLQNNFTLKEL
jgi:hypothetical protein